MNLNKQTITYSFIIIFIIITFIHLYKINNKNNNNDKENFADLMEDQNLQGFSVSINSMSQVLFGNTPQNKRSLLSFMDEKVSKTELNDSISDKATKTELNDAMPELSVISYAGSNAPTGWQLCDGEILQFNNGTNVNPSIHTKFSSLPKKRDTNNNEMSATPDLRGRFILGSGEGEELSQRDIHTSGGEETHTLTVAEMPNHDHKMLFNINKWGSSTGKSKQNTHFGTIVDGTLDTWTNTHPSFVMDNTGSSAPHNNMPPYYVLTYIIKQPSQPS